MNPETRQTLLGMLGLTVVQVVAIQEGFNGQVTMAYFASVVAMIAPKALESLPFAGGGE